MEDSRKVIIYKSIWWDAIDGDSLPVIMEGLDDWEIDKMFMVYGEERESYRIILKREVWRRE